MKNLTKLLALLLAAALVFSLAACSGGKEGATTTPETIEETDPSVTETEPIETPTDTTTEAPSETETETESVIVTTPPISDTTTKPTSTTEAPAPSEPTTKPALIAPVGGTAAQIVAFYNDAANATKANKNKMTISITEGQNADLTEFSLGLARGAAENMLAPMNTYPTKKSGTYTNGKTSSGDSILRLLPIDGDAKMSKLPASGVKSATCVKSGGGWAITIVLKEERSDDLNFKPPVHSSCMDTLNVKPEDLQPFTLNNASVVYTGATLKATVNADGLLSAFSVDMPVKITGRLGFGSFGLINAAVDGRWRQSATFTY
ncbi:MAG: hypothetical protein FWF05_06355 [Oscillospiraceae bacterium]|nr:hypothetical protein [Oscillospiraceae bacterium]